MILFFFFKLQIFTLPSFFMSSYGLIIMILGFCVSGSTAAVNTADAGKLWVGVPLKQKNFHSIIC